MRPPATRWVNVRTGGLMQPPDGSPRKQPDRRSKSYADRGPNGSLGATRASAGARRHASGAQSHLTAQAAHERGRGRVAFTPAGAGATPACSPAARTNRSRTRTKGPDLVTFSRTRPGPHAVMSPTTRGSSCRSRWRPARRGSPRTQSRHRSRLRSSSSSPWLQPSARRSRRCSATGRCRPG